MTEKGYSYREDIKGLVCDTCQRYWGENEPGAERCCRHTRGCPECGGEMTIGETSCYKCRSTARDKREQEQLDAAELIEYSGMFCIGDKWYRDEEEYRDDCEYQDIAPVEFAFVPVPQRVYYINLDSVLEDLEENCNLSDESAFEPIGYDALRKAVDAFNLANKDQVCYQWDTKKKFRISGW